MRNRVAQYLEVDPTPTGDRWEYWNGEAWMPWNGTVISRTAAEKWVEDERSQSWRAGVAVGIVIGIALAVGVACLLWQIERL